MVTVLVWLGIVLAALVALLLLLLGAFLLVPIELEGSWSEARRGGGVAGPGIRLSFDVAERAIELRVLRWRAKRWPLEREAARSPRKRRRRRGRSGNAPSVRQLWRDRRRILATLRAFFGRIRLRRLRVGAVIASPDPAWTGWLSGLAYAGRGALPERVRLGVRLRPDFTSETPEVEGELAVRLQPWILAALALRVWWIVRRARRARRRRDARVQPAGAAGGRDDAS